MRFGRRESKDYENIRPKTVHVTPKILESLNYAPVMIALAQIGSSVFSQFSKRVLIMFGLDPKETIVELSWKQLYSDSA